MQCVLAHSRRPSFLKTNLANCVAIRISYVVYKVDLSDFNRRFCQCFLNILQKEE